MKFITNEQIYGGRTSITIDGKITPILESQFYSQTIPAPQPYWHYNSTTKALIFNHTAPETGTPGGILPTDGLGEDLPWGDYVTEIQKVTIEKTISFTNAQGLFSSLKGVTAFEGLNNVDLSYCTTTQGMFFGDIALQTIDGINSLNMSNVKTIKSMFYSCSALKTLDISSWNLSSCTNLSDLFEDCAELQTVTASQFSTCQYSAKNIKAMFCNCAKLTEISGWNTIKFKNIKKLDALWQGCQALNEFDFTPFNDCVITSIDAVCNQLVQGRTTNLKIVGHLPNSKITNAAFSFGNCGIYVESLQLAGWDFSNVTDASGMFYCDTEQTILKHIYMDEDKIFNLSIVEYSDDMFTNCKQLHNFNSSFTDKTRATMDVETGYLEPTPITYYFGSDSTNLYIADTPFSSDEYGLVGSFLNTDISWCNGESFETTAPWNSVASILQTIYINSPIKLCGECKGFFAHNMANTINGLNNLNISRVTNLDAFFDDCGASEIDCSFLANAEHVKSYKYFFFFGASQLKNWDSANFNNVENINYMFVGMPQQTNEKIDLSPLFNHMKPYGLMEGLFTAAHYDSFEFKTLVTGLKTMRYMYSDMAQVETIDLTNVDLTTVEDVNGMFQVCPALKNIYVNPSKTFNLSIITNGEDMFWNCTSLPHYDENYVDHTRAIIDNGTNNGYLKVKS